MEFTPEQINHFCKKYAIVKGNARYLISKKGDVYDIKERKFLNPFRSQSKKTGEISLCIVLTNYVKPKKIRKIARNGKNRDNITISTKKSYYYLSKLVLKSWSTNYSKMIYGGKKVTIEFIDQNPTNLNIDNLLMNMDGYKTLPMIISDEERRNEVYKLLTNTNTI